MAFQGRKPEAIGHKRAPAAACRRRSAHRPRAPQRSFQSLPLLIPAGFYDLRFLRERFQLRLDGGGHLRVLLLGLVQRSLRLVDRLLTAFTVSLPGGIFLRAFALLVPLLAFVGGSSLPLRRLVDGARGRLLGLMAFRFGGSRRWSGAAKIRGQFGFLAERSVGSDGTPQNDPWLRHGRGDDVRIMALPRLALVEEVAVCAPRFQSGFHRRSRDREIEEAQRSLVGL